MYIYIYTFLHVCVLICICTYGIYSMLVLPHSPLASSRQGRDAGWHQPLHGCRGQDHLVRWAILGPQVLWLYMWNAPENHWIQTLEIRKNSIWPWFRSSHFSWIFSDTNLSILNFRGVFQIRSASSWSLPAMEEWCGVPPTYWSYGRHFMGCSTFSEYTVVADISCAKAGNG